MGQRKDDIEVLKLLSELAKSTNQEPLQKAVKDVIEEMFGDEVETEKKEEEEKTEAEPVEEKTQEEVKGGEAEEVKPETNPCRKRKAKPSKEKLEDEELETEEELEAEEEEEPETEEIEEEEEEFEEKRTTLTPEEIVIKAVAKIKDEVKELKKSIVDVSGLKDTLDRISGRLDKIEERLTKVEETPVGRKGITKAYTGTADRFEEKTQISYADIEHAFKKGEISAEDVVKFETLGIVPRALRKQ
jgi:hypothetical protein